MASQHFQNDEDLHFRVLRLLQEKPDQSQCELAARLEIGNSKLHHRLKALNGRDLMKLGNFASSKHDMGYVYLLTLSGIAQKTDPAHRILKKRKITAYEALKAKIEASRPEVSEVEMRATGKMPQ